jgi:hypothetical protein
MLRIILFVPVALLCSIVVAQKKQQKEDLLVESEEWYEGSILLTSGTELKGVVMYNDRTGILSFQDGTETRVFTPRSVTAFEFFDESLRRQRVFYTFEDESSEDNIIRPSFFELVRDYKTFSVWIKTDRLERNTKNAVRPQSRTWYQTAIIDVDPGIEFSQVQTIYLMDPNMKLEPYIKVTNSEIVGRNWLHDGKSTRSKALDRDLLEDYVSKPVYEKLVAYARENKLKFQRTGDFFKILDYYGELIK